MISNVAIETRIWNSADAFYGIMMLTRSKYATICRLLIMLQSRVMAPERAMLMVKLPTSMTFVNDSVPCVSCKYCCEKPLFGIWLGTFAVSEVPFGTN